MTNLKRNGDWNLIAINKEEFTELSKIGSEFTSNVFAEGEATNHFHKIITKEKDDLEIVKLPSGEYVFQIKKDTFITHPEHSLKVDLKIEKGYYKLYKGREKDWFLNSTRKIID